MASNSFRIAFCALISMISLSGMAFGDSYFFRSKGNLPVVAANPATAALTFSGLAYRSNSPISGAIETSLTASSWTFSQTPKDPSLALTAVGDGVAGMAPNVASTTIFSVTGTASSESEFKTTAPASITIYPPLAVLNGTPDGGPYEIDAGGDFPTQPDYVLNGVVGFISYELVDAGLQNVNLPSVCSGLSFSSSTGKISGTATAACFGEFRVVARDSFDNTQSVSEHSFVITVTNPTIQKTLANATNVTLSSLFAPAEWSSDKAKIVVVPVGVRIGSTSPSTAAIRTGSGWGGSLTLQIDGEVQGKSGNGIGGDAIEVQSPGINIVNNGAIRAAGGAGGKGGTGGLGVAATNDANWEPGKNGIKTPSAGKKGEPPYTMVYNAPNEGLVYFYWNSTTPIGSAPIGTHGIQVGNYYYTDCGSFTGDGVGAAGPIRRALVANAESLPGGDGGLGGNGRGYQSTPQAGLLGTLPAGYGAGGRGGTGGTGGEWGQPGQTGQTGAPGAGGSGEPGSPGYQAGYSIRNAASAVISGSGIRQGL